MKILMASIRDLTYDSRVKYEEEVLRKFYDIKLVAPKGPQTVLLSLWKMFSASWEDFDVYHAHDIEALFCLYPAALLKRKILIYDSHEIWTKLHPFSNLRLIQWLFKLIEKIGVKKAKVIITVNQSVAKYLSRLYHKPTYVIYNYPKYPKKSLREFKSLKKKFPGKKIILYAGGFNEGRGLEEIIEAAKFLDNSYQFLFLGYGNWQKQIEEKIRAERMIVKVLILPAVKPEEVIDSIRGADIGLCLIQKTSLSYYYSTPNKIFQYVAAEIPILGSNFPEIAAVVQNNKIGEVISPTDPRVIARKISWMLESKRQKKYRDHLRKIKNKYTWEEESKKLLKIYKTINI